MDRLTSSRQGTKVIPTTLSEEVHDRDESLPVGSTLTFPRSSKPPSQQKNENINVEDQPGATSENSGVRREVVKKTGTNNEPASFQQRNEPLDVVSPTSSNQLNEETQPYPPKNELDKELPVILQVVNPYVQPFTIETAFSLQIPDQEVQYHLMGYNIFQETRTSK